MHAAQRVRAIIRRAMGRGTESPRQRSAPTRNVTLAVASTLPAGSVSQPRVKAMLPLLCSTSPHTMIRPGRAGLTKLVLDSTVTAMRLAGRVA